MDPEIAAIVEQLGGSGISFLDVAAGTAPQTSILGWLVWKMVQRAREAEAKWDAILELCKTLDGSTVDIGEILGKMVTKDKSQHLHNRWLQDAILKLVRRSAGNGGAVADVDELELTRPPRDEG